MIDTALSKAHGVVHSYATWTSENHTKAFGVAAVKCALLTTVVILYQKYNSLYGDSIQTGQHTSDGVRALEDAGLSALSITLSILASDYYVKHPNLHPNDKKSADKEPDGTESVNGKPKTSREAEALRARMESAPRLGAEPRTVLRT